MEQAARIAYSIGRSSASGADQLHIESSPGPRPRGDTLPRNDTGDAVTLPFGGLGQQKTPALWSGLPWLAHFFSSLLDPRVGEASREEPKGPIPKSGRSWHLWQSGKARFSGKSDCIALYSGCGSYQSYLKPLV